MKFKSILIFIIIFTLLFTTTVFADEFISYNKIQVNLENYIEENRYILDIKELAEEPDYIIYLNAETMKNEKVSFKYNEEFKDKDYIIPLEYIKNGVSYIDFEFLNYVIDKCEYLQEKEIKPYEEGIIGFILKILILIMFFGFISAFISFIVCIFRSFKFSILPGILLEVGLISTVVIASVFLVYKHTDKMQEHIANVKQEFTTSIKEYYK